MSSTTIVEIKDRKYKGKYDNVKGFNPDAKYTKEEMEAFLTTQQKKFCSLYIVSYNAREAARQAGYSSKDKGHFGYILTHKPHIKAYLKILESDLALALDITKTKHLSILRDIVVVKPTDIYDDWMSLKDFRSVPEEIKACIKAIETKKVITKEGVNEHVKITFYCKLEAMAMLNKMQGWNAPEEVINKNLNVNVAMTADQIHNIISGE